MFRGDHPGLSRALGRGLAVARELGQPRAGSEHLLLGLSLTAGRVSAVLARHGMLRRADRRIALRARCTSLVGRYQRSSGRAVSNARMLPPLIQP